MQNETYLKLDEQAVVKLDEAQTFGSSTFVVQDLKNLIASQSKMGIDNPLITCAVLEPGGQWQRGRLKLVLEFVPEGQP